jgi:hypothetical protein
VYRAYRGELQQQGRLAPPLLPGWRLANAGETASYAKAVVADGSGGGTPVHSTIGPLRVDLDAIDAFFADKQGIYTP